MSYIVFNLYLTSIQISDSLNQTRPELISSIISISSSVNKLFSKRKWWKEKWILFSFSFKASFIIYSCVSSRFRKQLGHIVFDIHLKNCRDKANRRINKRVDPSLTSSVDDYLQYNIDVNRKKNIVSQYR